jgi:hypothetical protein
MPIELIIIFAGGMLLYVGYLHLQLHISHKVNAALRATNVTLIEKPASKEYRPMLAALAGIVLVVLAMLNAGN